MEEEWHITAYADDTVIWALSMEDLEKKTKIFEKKATESNMLVNKTKTEILTRKDMTEEERKLWASEHLGKEIPDGTEVGKHGKLVGDEINILGKTKQSVAHRREKATQRYKALIAKLSNTKGISVKIKMLIMEMCLDSVMSYSMDTEQREADLNSLNEIQTRAMMKILKRENEEEKREKMEEIKEAWKKKAERDKNRSTEEVQEQLQAEMNKFHIEWNKKMRELLKLEEVPSVASKCKKAVISLAWDTVTKNCMGRLVTENTKWENDVGKKRREKAATETAKKMGYPMERAWSMLIQRLDKQERISLATEEERASETFRASIRKNEYDEIKEE